MDRHTLLTKSEKFARRLDRTTGQIESICLTCFCTVARSPDVQVLDLNELQHDCPRANLEKEKEQ
jgi:hypothetical protein